MSDCKLTLFVNEKTLIPDLIKRPLVGYYATILTGGGNEN